ncbi:MAG TPA: GGDEF domain-containing protein [Xanthomonadales bacterium]|nr:GGDEF domain-containing protein [Xanthomonadales bacterium]
MLRRDSYSKLRETLRWRVALALGTLVIVLMIVLGIFNTRNGYTDTAFLAWAVLAVVAGCMVAVLALPRKLGGNLFFTMTASVLVLVLAFGGYFGRPMQHWAYLFPPMIAFLLRSNLALVAMLVFGVYATWISAALLPVIDSVRFASGYGLLVCFMYTYALLEERAATMLRFHSDHDALSNCLNRRTFNEEIAVIEQEQERCTFLLIDIDHFKAINDQRGHLVGDRVITEAAATLGAVLAAGSPLYRYGGEEFALMSTRMDEAQGLELAERLRSAIAGHDFAGMTVTVSIGVATWYARDGSIAAALSLADQALYVAKRAGRNRVVAASRIL